MPIVRYLVEDVDAALPFYAALGFTVAERWGPPFVMLAREGLELWLSGARFRSDPVQGPGGRQVLVDDPSGNPIELFESRR